MWEQKEYEAYIERIAEIRALSTPSLSDINDANEYRKRLRSNFIRIGELAAKNREFLDTKLFPILKSEEIIDDEEKKHLEDFSSGLINAENCENLDLSIAAMIGTKLTSDAEKSKDFEGWICRLDRQIEICYELMLMTNRIHSYPAISEHYRNMGFTIGRTFMKLLDKDTFLQVKDTELREMILTNARYSVSFYDGVYGDAEKNKEQIAQLEKLYRIAHDPFYQDAVSDDFDWIYYMFRLFQYYVLVTEKNNAAGLNREQLELIYQRTLEMMDFWEENETYIEEELSETEDRTIVNLALARNSYITGRMTRGDYIARLLKIYENRAVHSYGSGEYYTNMCVPVEMIALVEPEQVTAEEKELLYNLYQDCLSYAFYMPNNGSMIQFIDYFYRIIDSFVEIPGGMTFEEMMLQSMAALHPPTYVHTQMVAKITECLCAHLVRLMPQKLVGVLDTKSAGEVQKKQEEITRFAYHAALCHDCGKLSIIDTVFIYGRRLLDTEFDLIKTHPKTGYDLLMRHPSTRAYADVALGHHRWHDDSRGYPEDFETIGNPVKGVIDLVLCADCLDAATDTVGRSYNRGKTVDEFMGELSEGSGSRYAAWLLDLFHDEAVKRDVENLLKNERDKKYKEIYYLLRDMSLRVKSK